MEKAKTPGVTENSTIKSPKLTRVCYDKYDVEAGFTPWKEDLFKFVSCDFQNKLHSANEEEKQQAIDEVEGWTWVSCISEVFSGTWGDSLSLRKKAKAALLESKDLANQCGDSFLVNSIDAVIKNCSLNPQLFSE